MRHVHKIASGSAALLAIWFTSCTIVKAPSNPEGLSTGKILVSAEDPYEHQLIGGTIRVDGVLQSGVLTPDTITVAVGEHWVRVDFQNFWTDSNFISVAADSLTLAVVVLSPINPDVGSAVVTAQDSSSGAELPGAAIFLDGATTGLLTPDTVLNIPVGMHTLGAGILGHDFRDAQLDVVAGLSSTADLLLPAVSWNGIHIISSADPAQVCIDDRLFDATTPWVVEGIPGGLHSFSCYRDGYATLNDALNPALQVANLFVYGHQELSFGLESWGAGTGYQEGKLAPGFELPSDQTDTIALGGYRGRVVLVTFWFRDCTPCMQEMPYIQQAYSNFSSQGFRVLAVNPMFNDNLQDLQEVRELLGLTFEMLMDQGYSVTLGYGANQFPTNVLIDQRGVVDWYTGSLTYEELSQRVQALLNP